MADLAVWQRTIVDEEGNVIPGAEIEVRREEDGSLATLYADRAGETPLANPLAADMSGFVRFFANGGAYQITATGAGASRTWRFDGTGRLAEFDQIDADRVSDDESEQTAIREKIGALARSSNLADLDDPIEAARNLGAQADLTVKIPTDFSTLQDAVDFYSRVPVRQGATIELLIESGHALTNGLLVENGDYGHFRITAEDSVVYLDPAFVGVKAGPLAPSGQDDTIILGRHARMPSLACLIDAEHNPVARCGYWAFQCSTGRVESGCGVRRAHLFGIRSRDGSSVMAVGAIATDTGVPGSGEGNGIYANEASRIACRGADVSGSVRGFVANRGSIIDAWEGIANDCGEYGVWALRGSTVVFYLGECDNAGEHSLWASYAATIDARQSTLTDATVNNALATNGSLINLDNATVTGAGTRNASADGGSKVVVRSATVTGAGENDLYVTRGGIIACGTTTYGTTNITPNTLSGLGIIFDPSA